MRSPRRSGIALPLLVFAGLLAGVELVARAALPHYPSRNFFLTLFGDPTDGTPPAQKPLFEGDPVRFWRLRPNVDQAIWDFTMVSTNAQGLRHPDAIGKKSKQTFRVVCVGDSVTFGFRIPLVFPDAPGQYDRNDAPYPGRLERMLEAEFPGRDIEVVALAVPGYSSHQGRLLLEEAIGWLEPDLVVICFGFNDVARKHFPDKQLMSRDFVPTTLRTVMSSSQTLLHAWRWWSAREHGAVQLPEPAPRVSRGDYAVNIMAMVALARAHGAGVLVLGPVYRDRTTNRSEASRIGLYRWSLRELMLEQGVPYLQIDELTEMHAPHNSELFGEHIHPSSMGHQLMAERVLQALRAHGLLARLADRDVTEARPDSARGAVRRPL